MGWAGGVRISFIALKTLKQSVDYHMYLTMSVLTRLKCVSTCAALFQSHLVHP